MGARFWISQDVAVVDPAGDDRDAALEAQREQLLEPHLVEQRVAAREQETVEVRLFRKLHEHLGLVHSGADGAYHPVLAQLIEGAIRAIDGVVEMVVGVMNVEDVDTPQAKPDEALLDRAHHAVVREIEYRVQGWNAPEHLPW